MRLKRLCGAGLTGRENGTWHLTRSGEYVYEVEDCALARPTAVTARRCLSGRHLLFIGDSISRYMYLSLASFLVHGSWPDDAALVANNASVCHEMTWHTLARKLNRTDAWNVYMEGTNAALGGHEVCDCYRASTLFENRYLRVGGAALTFMSQLVSNSTPMKGHVFPDNHKNMREKLRCRPGQCSSRPAWQLPLIETIETLLPRLGATDVLYNTGHWSPVTADDTFFQRLFAALRGVIGAPNASTEAAGASRSKRAISSPRSAVWWRTSTPVPRYWWHGGKDEVAPGVLPELPILGPGGAAAATHPPAVNAARQEGVGVLDIYAMTSRLLDHTLKEHGNTKLKGAMVSPRFHGFTYDHLHFMCSVNREIITLILNTICDPHEL